MHSASHSVAEPDFGGAWGALASFTQRGWIDVPVDAVLRRIQGMRQELRLNLSVVPADQDPFEGALILFAFVKLTLTGFTTFLGSLKVLLTQAAGMRDDDSLDSGTGGGTAALRLTESEDDSCLWQMRCDDEALRGRLKLLLSDG